MNKILALFCITLGTSIALQQFAYSQEKPTVKIGALLSFSGGLEQWCGYIRQGIELAASEENPVKMDVSFEDDQSVDKKTALIAAQKLVQINKVDLLYSWTASDALVLAPLATSAHVPFLVGAYDHNVSQGGPYVFGAFVNYDRVSREIAKFLIVNKGAHRLGLIMAADDWSKNFESPFRDEAQTLGAKVVFAETISPDETDTNSLVLKLKKENVDAVLAPLYSSSLFSFLKSVHQMRYPGAVYVGDGMFEEDIKTAGADAEGAYASQIWLDSPELLSKFQKHFGKDANALQLGLVATGYDWVKHLQGAANQIIRNGKTISRETLKNALQTFQSHEYLGDQMYGAPPETSGEITTVVRNGRYIPVRIGD